VGKPEGKRPLGRRRRRWMDNIKTDLREIDEMVWTGSSWLRIGTIRGLLWRHGNASGKFLSSCTIGI
jgi:hypothetical protein